ncbi:MAG: VanW family protein, partial [Actinomycetia bacterium]|nr:VanW family protein [Actinomycetes bacterium]
LVGSAVTLRVPGQTGTMVFTAAGLTSALRSEIVVNSPAVLEVSLDTDTLTSIAARSAEQFTVPPTDAAFAFDDETKTLTVVPAVPGMRIDLTAVPGAVEKAALSTRTGLLVLTDGAEAEFTTEMAEAMGPFDEVSTFTTKHPAGQSRVTNIQLLADEIGGNFVMPDEIFSINDTAGERTLGEGYVRAGAIINGRIECCDSRVNIGGGTSQFATTFYNAVFFGCYEDIFHQPHSLYFPRYPFVREATLGFPAPDVKFRNDSDSVVYIDTTYTPSSITVTLYGNNGGRVCTSERSGNTITRVMTHPDGSVTTQNWSWNYKQPRPPDDAPAHEDHDDTTTTTSGDTPPPTTGDTTTTTPAETTTTTADTTATP